VTASPSDRPSQSLLLCHGLGSASSRRSPCGLRHRGPAPPSEDLPLVPPPLCDLAISGFPKWCKYLISQSFRGKVSVRPVQVGGVDVNTFLSELSWLLRMPNVDRILPLGRVATVRQGPRTVCKTGSKPSAAESESHCQARPSDLDSICGASRCRSRR